MKIVFVASECVPFAKTGGLGDVVGSLPLALKQLGHDVRIILPKYGAIDFSKVSTKTILQPMGVWMGNTQEWCTVHQTYLPSLQVASKPVKKTSSTSSKIPENQVPVYFIEFNNFFARPGLYHDDDFNDYQDNPRRFAFFSRAALQLCKDLSFKPDIVHSHDWQTALSSAYLKIWHWNDPILGDAASMLTIHNLAYQGVYSKYHYPYMGLQEQNFVTDQFEDHGRVNMLKGGIYASDMVNTVSPGYARETKTPIGGYGLAPYLNNKGESYFGILNGVDYQQWNPEKDRFLPQFYSPKSLEGKKVCKKALQKVFLLEQNDSVPIIGVISRFVDQKGLHLLAECIKTVVKDMIVQFVILGSGDKGLESFFGGLPALYPGTIGSYIGFHNEYAHLIEAGSDFFLMPSLYEPCGLNQIYSLKYGTLPIVRATGGLDDTVDQYQESTGEGTGFKFYDISARSLYYTIGWAVSTYYDRKDHIQKMMQTAMEKDYSWEKSAIIYEQAYQKAINNKKKQL